MTEEFNPRDNCFECLWFEGCDGTDEDCVYSPTLPGKPTNGDVIKDMLNPYKICEDKCLIKVYLREEDYWEYDEYIMTCNAGWWNMPYNSESEDKE